MAMYLIGDIQGCDAALQSLLDTVDFSASRDRLFALGDLVNRGPASAAVLRRLMRLGSAATNLLGNHDLNLLAVAHGVRKPHRNDTLDSVLDAPDRHAMLEWLRHQHMAWRERIAGADILMVHAGVLPSWTSDQTMALANEVETVLRAKDYGDFLREMYGNSPDAWNDDLQGTARLRVIVNALTRLRFCTPDGVMEFKSTEGAAGAPAGFVPWFDAPQRATSDTVMAFGHWSTLGWLGRRDVYALDGGCVWGGCLNALRVQGSSKGLQTERFELQCEQAQRPGG